jgi:hypothetical protein
MFLKLFILSLYIGVFISFPLVQMTVIILSGSEDPAVPSKILSRNFEVRRCVILWKVQEVDLFGEVYPPPAYWLGEGGL